MHFISTIPFKYDKEIKDTTRTWSFNCGNCINVHVLYIGSMRAMLSDIYLSERIAYYLQGELQVTVNNDMQHVS